MPQHNEKGVCIGGWTVETLKHHILSLIDAHDRRYEERFALRDKAVTDAFAAAEKAVNAALAAADKAVTAAMAATSKATSVAETTDDKWRANANEWRQAMDDREKNFLSRSMGYVLMAVSIVAGLLAIFSYYIK